MENRRWFLWLQRERFAKDQDHGFLTSLSRSLHCVFFFFFLLLCFALSPQRKHFSFTCVLWLCTGAVSYGWSAQNAIWSYCFAGKTSECAAEKDCGDRATRIFRPNKSKMKFKSWLTSEVSKKVNFSILPGRLCLNNQNNSWIIEVWLFGKTHSCFTVAFRKCSHKSCSIRIIPIGGRTVHIHMLMETISISAFHPKWKN